MAKTTDWPKEPALTEPTLAGEKRTQFIRQRGPRHQDEPAVKRFTKSFNREFPETRLDWREMRAHLRRVQRKHRGALSRGPRKQVCSTDTAYFYRVLIRPTANFATAGR